MLLESETVRPVWLFLALSAFLFYAYQQISLALARRAFKKANGCKPAKTKYPLKDPIFGLDLLIETIKNAKKCRHLEGTFRRYEKYGKTFTSKMVYFDTILTIEPENIKALLATKFDDFRLSTIRVRAMAPIFGKGIFTTDGPAWAHSRALLRPTFAKESIASLEVIETHFQHLIRCIPRDGGTVDLQELFFRLTMDTATQFLFGHSVNSQSVAFDAYDPNAKKADAEFVDYYTYTQLEASHNVRLGPLARLRFNRKAEEARKKTFAYVDGYIDELFRRRAAQGIYVSRKEDEERKTPYVFLEELANQTTDRVVLRDQILNVLLAGRDTTASLLSNMFFMLARHPQVWEKLRAEVLQLNGDYPTYQQLRDMKYLKYCINESLRLHPVVPLNTREAVRDTFIPRGGGPDGNEPLFVKKGTQVLYSVYSMHRYKEFYGPDAEEFRPERWAEISPKWEYLPFNGGPRICLGQQFALTEASYVTVRLLQEFSGIEPRDPLPWMEGYTLVVCSKNGTQVGLTSA